MIKSVRLSKRAMLDLKVVPFYIQRNLLVWIAGVELEGLLEIRKIPGYHDESLKGTRAGQRSIRLNRSYRAIYVIKDDGTVEFIEILEVNKHAY
ncbi:MAG: hypothetical protein ACXVCP_07525 [Bdellovibrio sp.]